MDNFDRLGEDMRREHESFRRKAVVVIAVGWTLGLGLLCGAIYVAIHFLGKWW